MQRRLIGRPANVVANLEADGDPVHQSPSGAGMRRYWAIPIRISLLSRH